MLHMRFWTESPADALALIIDEILDAPVSPHTMFADGPPLFYPFGRRLFLPLPAVTDNRDLFLQVALKDVHTHAPHIATGDAIGRTFCGWPAPTNYDGLIARFRPIALATFVLHLDGGRGVICDRVYARSVAVIRNTTTRRLLQARRDTLAELPPLREVPALFRPTPAKKAGKK